VALQLADIELADIELANIKYHQGTSLPEVENPWMLIRCS